MDRRPSVRDGALTGLPGRLHWIRQPQTAVWALLASGALGFHLGYARFFDWQVPVETAQVLAGIVEYPEETPFFIYHVRLWTLLHQICALFLLAGVTEVALSRILSGVLGMLSLQALAMCAYAFSGRVVTATGVAVLIFVSQVTNAGAVYPIFLMGVPFTYGVVGLSLVVLVAALFGSGLPRAGAFLLGVAPALHTGLAFWLWTIVGICLMADRQVRDTLRASAPWLVAGAAAAGVSFAVHVLLSAGVPGEAGATSRRYLDAFVAFWDGHRRPIRLHERAVHLNAAGLVIATVWLRWFRQDVPSSAGFLLRFTQVSALVALALVPLTWVQPDRLPVPVLMLMPGRVVNIVAMLLAAMVLGLLGSTREGWRQALMLLMAGALLFGEDSLLWRLFPDGRPGLAPEITTHTIAYYAAAALMLGESIVRWRSRPARPAPRSSTGPVLLLALRTATLAIFAVAAVVAYRVPDARGYVFIDRTNNAVLATAAASPGLLLTVGDAHLTQLRTRRPLLIDTGGLDALAYMPATGSALNRILLDIYGIDLFNPPPDARGTGRLPAEAHRERWQRFRAEDWRKIRRMYHVTQVLTGSEWQLDLPIVAGDRRHLLYAIPD